MIFRLLICIMMLAAVWHGCAEAVEISIHFEDIDEYALKNSPHAFLLEKNLELESADRDLSLRWSNPDLMWEMERVDNGPLSLTEHTIALEKEITLPWVGARNRNSRNLRIEAAHYRKKADTWRLRSALRHSYVALKVYQTKGEFLGKFEIMMENASNVAMARKMEGAISGVEQRLIEMSMLAIRKMIHANREAYRTGMADWKTEMGIPAGTEVNLESDIRFFQGGLHAHLKGAAGVETTADIAGRQLHAEALGIDIKKEKGGILPSLTVAGGYKNIEDDFEGFVVGLSMPIPLLNRNSGSVDRARVEHEKARLQLDLYRSARSRHIAVLTASAGEKAELIDRYTANMERIDEQIEDLTISYREGWMPLAALLEGVDVYTDGIEHYFELFEEYYAVVFELEALLERELLNPALQEMEDSVK